MLAARGDGVAWLASAMDALATQPDFNDLGMHDLLNHLVAAGRPIQVIYVRGHWLDVNSLHDLERAGSFAAGSDGA